VTQPKLRKLRVGAGTKAGLAITVLALGWLLALNRTPRPATLASPAAAATPAFVPVPNTSPVPKDFLATYPVSLPPATIQEGSRTEFFLFQSDALARPMHYLIYEPAGYTSNPTQRYPVLYLLHGIGAGLGGPSGYETEWPGYGLLTGADALIVSGVIQPLLIVMPEGDQSYWMDAANGGPKYGTYVSSDLVREVDSRFRTRTAAGARAIGGLSMGGFGALSLAMLNPDVFGTVGAHSPSLPRREQGPSFFGDADYFAAHNPVDLIRDHPNVANSLHIWLDVSDQDPLWAVRTEALHRLLSAKGVAHEWHEWAGNHDGLYWNAHISDYLRFYNSALNLAS
jgi:enterochelin esterase-like enzyme